jgi:hypothetical protein
VLPALPGELSSAAVPTARLKARKPGQCTAHAKLPLRSRTIDCYHQGMPTLAHSMLSAAFTTHPSPSGGRAARLTRPSVMVTVMTTLRTICAPVTVVTAMTAIREVFSPVTVVTAMTAICGIFSPVTVVTVLWKLAPPVTVVTVLWKFSYGVTVVTVLRKFSYGVTVVTVLWKFSYGVTVVTVLWKLLTRVTVRLAPALGSNGRPPSPARLTCHSEAPLRQVDVSMPVRG